MGSPLYSQAMAAGYLRMLLIAEIGAYAVIGLWIHATLGWSYAAVAALAVTASVAIRALIVMCGVALSNLARSPRAPGHRIGPAAALALFAREWYSVLSTNYWLFPFERWALRPDRPAGPSATPPVLLVHGYFSNRGYFNRIVPMLEARGVAPVFTPNFPSAFGSIERLAAALDSEIERLCAATGQSRLVLVCHSMGGLAARTYLCGRGPGRVRKLITIGTPHHGTVIAWFGMGRNAAQMRPGSRYLRELEAREGGEGPACETVSIYTPHDNLVAPQASSILPRARNVAIPGHGHVDLLESPRLLEVMLEELRAAGVRVG